MFSCCSRRNSIDWDEQEETICILQQTVQELEDQNKHNIIKSRYYEKLLASYKTKHKQQETLIHKIQTSISHLSRKNLALRSEKCTQQTSRYQKINRMLQSRNMLINVLIRYIEESNAHHGIPSSGDITVVGRGSYDVIEDSNIVIGSDGEEGKDGAGEDIHCIIGYLDGDKLITKYHPSMEHYMIKYYLPLGSDVDLPDELWIELKSLA
jgi:hypothetical protein